MKITISSLATLSLFALMTNAAPIDDASGLANATEVADLERRQGFSWLTMYDDVGYKGKSMGIYSDSNGECINLNNNVKDKMSSFILANDFLYHPRACRFYDNNKCNPNFGVLDNQRQSVSDLRSIGWNDRIASVYCVYI